ncbi:GM25413 [Drosophila sechellia]|uniref:GM25413 n=1 Tax=Drosophila sechellia TaxID=7238 RepID=B4HGR3_DROSE|nr:GM25413 [Drosophila sechellia]
MAKLALCILVFALFALALSARVPREEPAEPNLIKEYIDKAAASFKEFAQKIQEFEPKAEELAKQGINTVTTFVQKVNETLSQAPAAST